MTQTTPTETTICPRCERHYADWRPSLSRRDNATPVCSLCGTEEALVDWFKAIGAALPWDWVENELALLRHIERAENGR